MTDVGYSAELHDPVTGLPGPALLLDRLGQALAREPRPGCCLALLVVELDAFDDTDETVRVAAACLLKPLGRADTLAHLEGCRFAVLCEGVERERAAREVAESLGLALLRPLPVAGRQRRVSASIGIAIADHPDHDPRALLATAEQCLDEARREGDGTVVMATRVSELRRAERLALEDALRHALHERQLRLFYQPIVSLPGGEVTAVEALLRWQHPTRGLVSPAEFLPVAEESGIIVAIGAWAFREACHEAIRWPVAEGRPLPVQVNLAAAQVTAPDFGELVDETLAQTGLPADRVGLEVTENVLLQPSRPIVLRQLRNRGLRVSLDDFGTGIWTRDALGHLPIDAVKFDRALVSRLGDSYEAREAFAAATATAGALGLRCVAEGVENAQQADDVRQLGCGFAQGYHFARPMTGAALRAHLAGEQPSHSPRRPSRVLGRLAGGLPGRHR